MWQIAGSGPAVQWLVPVRRGSTLRHYLSLEQLDWLEPPGLRQVIAASLLDQGARLPELEDQLVRAAPFCRVDH